MTRPAAPAAFPPPPAHVAPYVAALGLDRAVAFLLAFGGAEIYLADRPQARSQVAAVVGADGAAALASRLGRGSLRIPTAKPWIAAVRRHQGRSVAEIARELHASDVAVRGWLKRQSAEGAGRERRQMDLFDRG